MDVWYRILLFIFFVKTICAQTAQSYWTVPDGQLPDFQQTFKNQQVLPIAWNGWDSDWTGEYLEGLSIVDLWVTSFNYDQYPYSHLIHGMVLLYSLFQRMHLTIYCIEQRILIFRRPVHTLGLLISIRQL